MKYKRLTNKDDMFYFEDCRICEENKSKHCNNCNIIRNAFRRLHKLEDKIEDGTLIELSKNIINEDILPLEEVRYLRYLAITGRWDDLFQYMIQLNKKEIDSVCNTSENESQQKSNKSQIEITKELPFVKYKSTNKVDAGYHVQIWHKPNEKMPQPNEEIIFITNEDLKELGVFVGNTFCGDEQQYYKDEIKVWTESPRYERN